MVNVDDPDNKSNTTDMGSRTDAYMWPSGSSEISGLQIVYFVFLSQNTKLLNPLL